MHDRITILHMSPFSNAQCGLAWVLVVSIGMKHDQRSDDYFDCQENFGDAHLCLFSVTAQVPVLDIITIADMVQEPVTA